MEKIAGVVVLYNPEEKDLKNINSYINELDILYIVDNSEKESEYKFDSPKIKYIFNNGNLGIAKALNIAANYAIMDNYKWLLTMDQDTKMNEEVFKAFHSILTSMDITNVGIITPWHDTKLNIEKPKKNIDYPLDVMTSGNFVNLDIYNNIGGFKEDFFIDGVDIEYCLNLKKNNYKIMRLNYVSIEHNLGNIKFKKIFNKEFMCTNHNFIRNYYMARNYRYIKKEYKDIAPEFCKTLVKYKGIVFKIIMFENDKYRKIRNIFRGILDYNKNIVGKYRYKN